ncbi:ompA family protein [Micavibrio aeruginosavorus ARL-13]|uniref:OmpA family protein n=1 Tax=Micavibrio aeruginosavorus (strain ARL-13) TaxID=856793 RepID=G2KLY4_MICAA|nr:ompA family protein [Micavibrio aeruginosavorus ARL-13]
MLDSGFGQGIGRENLGPGPRNPLKSRDSRATMGPDFDSRLTAFSAEDIPLKPFKLLTLSCVSVLALSMAACGQFARDLDTAFNGGFNDPAYTVSQPDITMPTPPARVDYNSLAAQYSNSSVQLYTLDDAPVPVRQSVQMPGDMRYAAGGLQASTDPSVTVFPFADGGYVPGVRPTQAQHRGGPLLPMPTDIGGIPTYAGSPARIYFEHGSAALSATTRQVLGSVAQRYLEQTPGYMVEVGGHASTRTDVADPVKSRIINFDMSMKRAMAVTKQLIRDGVPVDVVKATAYGDTHPAVVENSAADEARNRRVEIITRPR